jgi:hypothetical protein
MTKFGEIVLFYVLINDQRHLIVSLYPANAAKGH